MGVNDNDANPKCFERLGDKVLDIRHRSELSVEAQSAPDVRQDLFDDFDVQRPGASEDELAVERVLAYRPGFVVDSSGQLTQVIGLRDGRRGAALPVPRLLHL